MSEQIQLREFIVDATRHWPILLIFCLAGSLLGWGISIIFPSNIRATTELYVGLNVDNFQPDNNAVFSVGPKFISADDYKNWQMANLNSLVYMDEVLDETLSELRNIDPFWNNITRSQLRKSLHVYWRNAGKWRLVAEGFDHLRVGQAVTVWQDIVVDRVHRAVMASEQLMGLEKQMEGVALTLTQKNARIVELGYFSELLLTRRDSLVQRALDQPLSDFDRWSIWQPVAQADLGTIWQSFASEFPAAEAPFQDYVPWIDRVRSSIEQEIQSLHAQKVELEKEKSELTNSYSQISDTSLGLSVNLEVEKISADVPQAVVVRPTSSLIFIGMFIGLSSWLGYWLAVYSLSAPK